MTHTRSSPDFPGRFSIRTLSLVRHVGNVTSSHVRYVASGADDIGLH
jgi:hypothetical protein